MKKPKPATAGEKIADTTTTALSRRKDPTRIMEWNAEMDRLSHRIDRAIARAVRKERERCRQIVVDAKNNPNTSWASCADMSNILLKIDRREP